MERWLVCGGRDYSSLERACEVLDRLEEQRGAPGIVIQGGARGADWCAAKWAQSRGHHFAHVPALWGHHKHYAGPLRNEAMLLLRPDIVIAFPGGRGTDDMKRRAYEADIELLEVE